jgi:WD40 repeat protein/subtilisin-like proprotein convertase family protein
MGKSSLMARAIKSLRGEGQLAAVVGLNQIGARAEGTEPGRWYYSIAYRIVRELRLKVDLQSWWQEKSALMSEQRLAEFFWEIVLTNTSVPVTVFFDEIQRAADLPFSRELFSAIRACYTGRATEPDLCRLNFVVLGVATPGQLCPDSSVSPFDFGRPIELRDFTLDETYRFTAGFGGDTEEARRLLDRVYAWAGGQPYLTQKIARGVARRRGTAADVERVVKAQFLSPGTAQEEPLLNHIRSVLTQGGARTRQALTLLSKLGAGQLVASDPGSPAQQILSLAGVTRSGSGGELKFRNRLYRETFSPRWVRSKLSFDWRRFGVAAAVVALAVTLPLWYVHYLPRPYVRTLSGVTEDLAVAEDAYEKLRRLPGFRAKADRLLAEVLTRRSRQADSYADIEQADARLRQLSPGSALADRLLGEYWLKRASEAVRGERRDEALLLASRALRGRPEAARALMSELIGDDYARLRRSVRLATDPENWAVDWQADVLTLVDRTHRAERVPLDPRSSRAVQLEDRLTALQHIPLNRELSVEEEGSAGSFRLEVEVSHPAAGQLLLTLEAPSGASANLALSPRPDGSGVYLFKAIGRSPLAALADEARQGVWRLTLVDRRAGTPGLLLRWGLQFADESRPIEDAPEQGVPIPEPARTEQVDLQLSADGRLAVAEPGREGAVGALAVWDLIKGALAADLQTPDMPDFARLAAGGSRLVTVTGDTLTLWDVASGTAVARLKTQTGFLLPPALSVSGDYVAIAEHVEPDSALFSLVRTKDGKLVASIEGQPGVRRWLLGPGGRFLALLGPSRLIRVIDPRTGEVLLEAAQQRDVQRLMAARHGSLLVSVDVAGDIEAWPIATGGEHTPRRGRRVGITVDADSVSVSADASTVAFEAVRGYVVARDLRGRHAPIRLRVDRSFRGPVQTRLSPNGGSLLTVTGGLLQLWRLGDAGPPLGAGLDLSSLALDPAGNVAALGFRSGYVSVVPVSDLKDVGDTQSRVDYIGHQGAVSSLDVSVDLGMVVSGGVDGVVRVWDLATGAPTPHFMRHPAGPVHDVELSGDGRWIASAAEYSARIWRVSDGGVAGEVSVNGAALAVAFSPDSTLVAVGDSAGNVFFARPGGSELPLSLRAQAAVQAIAFSPRGDLLVTGDMAGNVQLWNVQTGEPIGDAQVFRHAVRWVGFSGDGAHVVVQTSHWLHRLKLGADGAAVLDSRLLEAGLEPGASIAAPGADRLRLIGGRRLGQPALYRLDLAAPTDPALPEDSPLLQRDWSMALGLTLDAQARVVPLAP